MKKYKWHVAFWFCDFWYGFLTDKIIEPDTHIISAVLFFITHVLFLFYSYLFLLNFIARKKVRIPLAGLLFLADISLFVLMRYILRFRVIPAIGITEPASLNLKVHFTYSLIWLISMSVYAIGYFYLTTSAEKERQLRIAQNEIQQRAIENMQLQQKQLANKLEAEKEKIQLENTLLRAQINPHFLFNTLGYFYNEISELHPQVGEGVAALADIMRSAIRKPDADGLIPLEEEVFNVEQLVSIYKLRYNDTVFISFQKEGDSSKKRILPHTFTTLVENGLKHGEIHNANHPLCIYLTISENAILFKTHNKKRIGPKELSHGIGMKFLRLHLDTVYENCYSLSINEDQTFYSAELQIAIKNKPAIQLMA